MIKRANIDKDCAPKDPTTHFQAIELMDGKDNNCDGVIDEPRFVYSKKLPSQKVRPPLINWLLLLMMTSLIGT